jgi:hypothetical protein
MANLTERLRDSGRLHGLTLIADRNEAADEIDRLRAENEQLMKLHRLGWRHAVCPICGADMCAPKMDGEPAGEPSGQ